MTNRNLTIIKHKSWLSILAIISALILTWLEKSLNQGETNYFTLAFIFLSYTCLGLIINADTFRGMRRNNSKNILYTINGFFNIIIVIFLFIGLGNFSDKNLLAIFKFLIYNPTDYAIISLLACMVIIISIIGLFTYYNEILIPKNKLLLINNLAYFSGEQIKIGPILYPKKIIIMNNLQEIQPIEKDIACHEGIKKVLIKLKVKNITGKVPRYYLNADIDTVLMEIKKSITVDLMNSSKEKTLLENLENIVPLEKTFQKGGYNFQLAEKELIIKNSLPLTVFYL